MDIFTDATCQEADPFKSTSDYVPCGAPAVLVVQHRPCGAPAVLVVQHRGRSEGPYFMCLVCGSHNARNRDAEVLIIKRGEAVTKEDFDAGRRR